MLETIQSLLDAFPEGVIQARAGLVLAANARARRYLPQLTPAGALLSPAPSHTPSAAPPVGRSR